VNCEGLITQTESPVLFCEMLSAIHHMLLVLGTGWATGETECYGLGNFCYDQATESCLGRCARERKVCRFNLLMR
jgi:hypothetical protein